MRKLIFFASLLALLVIVLGAYTRLSDAGLGCPDWPGCYGHIAVPQSQQAINQAETVFQQTIEPRKAWIEMIHRYLAGTLALCILIIAGVGIKRKSYFPLAIVLVVIFQALLGMWTVTLKLYPPIILLHLFGGLTILSLLWWYFLRYGKQPQNTRLRASSLSVLVGIGLLLLQIALGGWTSANYAALICPDFPYCQGQLLPPLDIASFFQHASITNHNATLVAIHMLHRFGAIIAGGYLLLLGIFLFIKAHSTALRLLSLALLLLVVTQITLGVLNIVLLLPMATAVSHNMVAAVLLIVLLTIAHQCQNIEPLKNKRYNRH